ncbi:unnamed protein product [Nippostrongylus brasiliensis]|uniref:JmjC domain-containing protein n=1 Tax=Nippostrongylus brasiliensis TaxID=27835 RepID=A0A0N4YFE1_NIPBR|nr:unnamed protein product [Nippostrongylus brasiliensis]
MDQPVSSLWTYLRSTTFVEDFCEAAYLVKKSLNDAWERMLYSRFERRVAAARYKDRPDLAKIGWCPLKLASKFALPPLVDKMPRVDGTTLSVGDFVEKYEKSRTPCILLGLTDKWKAHKSWTIENLIEKYGDEAFKCGESPQAEAVRMKFKYFAEYMKTTNDDSPLYIFDPHFGKRWTTEDMLLDYQVPEIFNNDFWIVIGSARSGTNIHIDPLGTSAWNALIHGHKRWVFIHPDAPRELVHIPKDQRGVHPKEAVTWFSTVYKRICDGDWPFDKYPVLECRQNPGETVLRERHPELMNDLEESMIHPRPISNGYTTSDDEPSRCSESEDETDESDYTIYSSDLSLSTPYTQPILNESSLDFSSCTKVLSDLLLGNSNRYHYDHSDVLICMR